ncbi:E3 ubiquitin-protein ligase UHRF1 [Rhizoctonia solani AG-1 IB]|uniref:E3 ubiquitin-protein ligase UHRF1 n=1 Tax=Thanatephorus cucumeris (strain AG1-IB / isolate 7/3/14) TaxID=1108050 RepID=M5CA84_THACB|nr:E3 ubiquitin-protein ligase UHRF1 [Rhizoctonia solani AG-1 IB]
MPKATAGLDHETDYEKIRRENMLSNQKLLQDLMLQKMDCPAGLAAGFAVLGIDEPKPKPKSKPQPKKAVKPKTVVKPKSEDEGGKTVEREGAGARRSARHAGKPTVSYAKDGEEIVDRSKMPRMVSRPDMLWNEDDSDAGEDEEGKVRVNKLVGRVHDPKTFGLIPGVPIGSWWETRAECSGAAIHAPFVAGISGGPEGAYSVALSGGYDDDIDMGDAFTYTGSGGRDLKGTAKNPKNLRTAPQSSHQSFNHSFNKALKVSSETRKPVRVIRGFKLPGVYAPETGYRYDGLYIVERAWMDRGNNPKGWKVCKFAFRRIPGQPPIPIRGKTSKAPATSEDVEMKDTDKSETDGQEGEEETGGEEEEKEEEAEESKEDEEEEKEKPKKGKAGPQSKSKAGPKSKSKVKEESEGDEEEQTEEEKPAPAKRGRKPKAQKEESTVEEVEEKPKRGRKPGPKAKQEPESEDEQPIKKKPGRPKAKVQSEPESSESVSKRGRKSKAASEPEEEEEEEESVPPAKKSKVEEAPKKKGPGRPPKNKK